MVWIMLNTIGKLFSLYGTLKSIMTVFILETADEIKSSIMHIQRIALEINNTVAAASATIRPCLHMSRTKAHFNGYVRYKEYMLEA